MTIETGGGITLPVGVTFEHECISLVVVPSTHKDFGYCTGCYFFTKMKHCPEQYKCGIGRTDNQAVIFKEIDKRQEK